MIINYIGSPINGKTTNAVQLFAYLKGLGINTELVTEYARHYIAKSKHDKGTQDITLTNDDQYHIMSDQYLNIEHFRYSSNGSIIICDSSPINALLYMEQAYIDNGGYSHLILDMVNRTITNTNVFFYCKPIYINNVVDPNRVHTLDQSLEIDKSIPGILNKYCPKIIDKMFILDGNMDIRFNKTKEVVTELMLK